MSAGYFYTNLSVLNNPVKIGKINTVCLNKIHTRNKSNESYESIFKAGERNEEFL